MEGQPLRGIPGLGSGGNRRLIQEYLPGRMKTDPQDMAHPVVLLASRGSPYRGLWLLLGEPALNVC